MSVPPPADQHVYEVEGASEVQTQLGALNNVPKGQRAETMNQVFITFVRFFRPLVKKPERYKVKEVQKKFK